MNCVIEAWEKNEQELRGFLIGQLHDSQQADDLLQDTFIKVLAEGSRFCRLDNARAGLFRVTRNRLIDYHRARKRLKQHLNEVCQVRYDDNDNVCCFVPRNPDQNTESK